MNSISQYAKVLAVFVSFSAFAQLATFVELSKEDDDEYNRFYPLQSDISGPDTTKKELKYPLDKDKKPGDGKSHPLDLNDPSNINKTTKYDTATGQFIVTRTLGDSTQLGSSESYSLDEYLDKSNDEYMRNYFKSRAKAHNFTSNSAADLKFKVNSGVLKDVLGDDFVDIKPQGSAELIFMGEINRVQNPSWSVRNQRNGQFKFDQKIRLNVLGKIGDKINLNLNYDTEANFEFDNQIKLNWQGDEDDIVKSIEAGNVSLPIQGSLIQGSTNLFGVKTTMQFGRLTVSAVVSKQNTERKNITVDGGSQKTPFNIPANEYDANKHYFLSHYFRNHYNEWTSNSPLVMSPIKITRIEVWVTNYNGRPEETRNMAAFMDMGEKGVDENGKSNLHYNNGVVFKQDPTVLFEGPANNANTLFSDILYNDAKAAKARDLTTVGTVLANESFNDPDFTKGVDYSVLSNVRKLSESEFVVHDRLGFISLKTPLQDNAVLAVCYEYTMNGETKQVGEFSRDVPADPTTPNVLFLKMLKSPQVRTDLPVWDLMMKNVYSLGSNRIEEDDFRLEIIYADDESGIDLPYIPEASEKRLNGTQLIKVMNVDKINRQQQPMPDGVFDFVPNLTIDKDNGFVYLPVLEPFGEHLYGYFDDKDLAEDYVFRALYDSIQQIALQDAYYNKFFLRGFFKGSSGDEIPLNTFNIQPGSVKVTAGGVELVENQDYRVDYALGRVKILNESILNSGQQINVSVESNTLFQTMQKSLYGTRWDYKFTNDFAIGGTLLHMRQRPITQKVNIGSEPLKNTIYGFDGRYRTDSRYLTKLVNKLPFIDTKEKSEISLSGEYAHLIPGYPKVIGPTGCSYIDDFEGSEVPYDLRLGVINWTLASTPQGQGSLFPYATTVDNDLRNNYKRAKMAWYILDPLFYLDNVQTPQHLRKDIKQLSNHYVRMVRQTEVFPQLDLPITQIPTQPTFDIAYYPKERGPYNYDVNGLNEDGTLKDPKDNWGGIMRRIETVNFEAANIQYLEFWLMDPYYYNPESSGGDMYINLGQVSEDVLQDSRKSFEHGLPGDGSNANTVSDEYGRTPTIPNINHAFSNDPTARPYQDVGLDGLDDEQEKAHFDSVYLAKIKAKYGENSRAYKKATKDPSADNYRYFRGAALDEKEMSILERYKNYSNPQGNSPTPDANGKWPEGFSTSAKITPDDEDVNLDFTLNTTEAYYQYKVSLRPKDMVIGQNYINDILAADVQLKNGQRETIKWYLFKIPINSYQRKVGPIAGFKSMQFMRMLFTGFEDSVICRFAQLQLIRADWRRYIYDLSQPGEVVTTDPYSNTVFDVSTVNIVENSEKKPVRYVVPPGIKRQITANNVQQTLQNEQSLSLKVCNLEDGDARAVFKTTSFDVRQFKRLRMFVHAEGRDLRDNDLTLFIRIGTDLSGHYYQYEYPLKVTPDGTYNPDDIWPTENEISLLLNQFYSCKLSRDSANHPFNQPYSRMDFKGHGLVTVLGNPDLSTVRTIMIGIKNPRASSNIFDPNDDGLPKCAEVWVNELRLTDFDQTGGWAANARVKAKVADFAQIDVVGHRQTIGFGGIEQTLLQRSQQDERGIDFRSSFALDKFFPQKSGVKFPMYYDYSQKNIRPRWNPVQPDVLLEATLASMATPEDKHNFLQRVESVEIRRSLNFVNVTKARTNLNAKPMPWDISNFTGTYKFTETIKHDVFTTYDSTRTYTGILTYSYDFKQRTLKPFNKLSKYKPLRLLSDFNFNYLPSSFSFQGQLDRKYNSQLYRNNDNIESIVPPNYNKTFKFDRTYNFRYNITQGLKLNYNGTAQSIIDEPPGPISTQKKRDSVMTNLKMLGRPQQFTQSIGVNYNIPINKLPLLDFINASADYKGGYSWQSAPPIADTLGNSISNSSATTLNSQFNFVQLYNKSVFLRTINAGKSNAERMQKNREKRAQQKAKDKEESNPDLKTKPDTEGDEDAKEDEFDRVNQGMLKVVESTFRVLMAARSFNVNYTQNEGTQLPGFMPKPNYFGINSDQNAPGWPFVLGSQQDIRQQAATNGWLSLRTNQQNQFVKTYSDNLSGNATLEPFKAFRITVDFNRRYSTNLTEFFRNNPTNPGDVNFQSMGTLETGNLSMSFNSIKTAFQKPVLEDGSTQQYLYHPVIQQFEQNRHVISQRIADEKGITAVDDSTGYAKGYGPFSQDVLIPAFLSAMSGKDPGNVNLSPFWNIPMPNWRISYNGLSQLKAFRKLFRSVNINHSYRSTYTVNNFTSSLEYNNSIAVAPQDLPTGKDYLAKYQIQQISVSEQFAPLLGVDITWKNSWSTKFEYQLQRTMGLNFTNFQLMEMYQKGVTIGLGYRTRELVMPFKYQGKKWVLENDFNFRCDISIRENRQTLWSIDKDVAYTPNPYDKEENSNKTVAGSKIVNIAPTIDYALDKNLNLRIFYTRNVTKPFISASYPRMNTTFGFSLRYTLSG